MTTFGTIAGSRDRSVRISIALCRKVYEETYCACMEAAHKNRDQEADEDDQETDAVVARITAKKSAVEAVLNNLPLLDSIQGVREYIACVAWMQSRKMLDVNEANAFLYAAQCQQAALSGNPATPKDTQKAGPK